MYCRKLIQLAQDTDSLCTLLVITNQTIYSVHLLLADQRLGLAAAFALGCDRKDLVLQGLQTVRISRLKLLFCTLELSFHFLSQLHVSHVNHGTCACSRHLVDIVQVKLVSVNDAFHTLRKVSGSLWIAYVDVAG